MASSFSFFSSRCHPSTMDSSFSSSSSSSYRRRGPPATSTKSTCTTEMVEGLHRFEIRNYSRIKGLAAGEYIMSSTFTVAGYDWSVVYYPLGCSSTPQGGSSVYLLLMTDLATARATYDLRLVNQVTGRPCSVHPKVTEPRLFSTKTSTSEAMFGIKVMTTIGLEAAYVRDDRLTIECAVNVVGKPRVSGARQLPEIDVPPSDLPAHLGRLLEGKDRADVTFNVRGQKFPAHRTVLAMRSPVFNAELFGPMSESEEGPCITVEDVQPAVFKVLLNFIYTDSLPSMDDLDEDTSRELMRHLLVAADRYDMDRLKLLCESILSTSLNAQTVASTLALADRHNCHQLKDACVEFVISLGLNNDAVASKEDEQDQFCCFSIIKYLCREVGSILRIH